MRIRVRLYGELALKHCPDFEFEVPDGNRILGFSG